MFNIIWLVVCAIALLLLIILWFRLRSNIKFIVRDFRDNNVGVYGRKRKGKDLLFQKVIIARKEPYCANITYGYNLVKTIDLADLNLGKNTYKNFIDGTIQKQPRMFFERVDNYVSDSGNALPSQYQKELIIRYPSMPLFLSFQGHLYDSNTHFNYNGEYVRLWDKAREQVDSIYRALGNIVVPKIGIFARYRYYERVQTAEANLGPYVSNKILDSSQNKALMKQYYAQNGLIKDMYIFISFRAIKYDTRAFEKVIFDDDKRLEYPKKPNKLVKLVTKVVNKIRK